MKTDRYKDWESKFFAGEELTPEEELFLKNESDNPYFSFMKEEKQEKLDISFEDFLKQAEKPKVVSLPVKKSNFNIYWLAASLVLLMGISAFWMLDKQEDPKQVLVKNNPQPSNKPSKQNNVFEPQVNTQTQVFANDVNHKSDINKKSGKADIRVHFAQQKNETSQPIIDRNISRDTGLDYNPNYVIINGKPVYNEQEAIAVTEDAFNYFASNVTQTINQAENAQNVSKDLYQIINF